MARATITFWLESAWRRGTLFHIWLAPREEEAIDGRALRHAFESLDDDGSEEAASPAVCFVAFCLLHGRGITGYGIAWTERSKA